MKFQPDFDLEQFMHAQVPAKVTEKIPDVLRSAHKAVDEIMSEIGFFQTPGGEYARGDLINYSVDYQVTNLIDAGVWPFDYSWEYYTNRSGKYLKIKTREADLTIKQVQRIFGFPSNSLFRDRCRTKNIPNQLYLTGPGLDPPETGRPFLILGHGYQNLDFAFVGMPHQSERNWLYCTDNLMPSLIQVEENGPAVEDIPDELMISLKDELKEQLKDGAE